MAVRPIPEGYHTLTPYLVVRAAEAAIEFYKNAFGATELYRLDMPDGKVGHAEMQLGNSRFMLSDEMPQMGYSSPQTLGGTPFTLLVYSEDVDAAVEEAVSAGAEVLRPLQNQPWGDRTATLKDPYGHQWMMATHVEDVSNQELERRMKEMMATAGGECAEA